MGEVGCRLLERKCYFIYLSSKVITQFVKRGSQTPKVKSYLILDNSFLAIGNTPFAKNCRTYL